MTGRRVNLTDPDFEPTGAELQALAHRAFEGVAEKHERVLADLHKKIAMDREQLVRELRSLAASPR
jgi:hypothetical protein